MGPRPCSYSLSESDATGNQTRDGLNEKPVCYWLHHSHCLSHRCTNCWKVLCCIMLLLATHNMISLKATTTILGTWNMPRTPWNMLPAPKACQKHPKACQKHPDECWQLSETYQEHPEACREPLKHARNIIRENILNIIFNRTIFAFHYLIHPHVVFVNAYILRFLHLQNCDMY